ncbi:MAG: hypothetical protein ACK4GJ_03285 [bacterium]
MKILCFTNILAGLSVSIVEEDKEKFNNLLDFYTSDGNQIKNIPFILETVKKVEKIENIDSIFVTTGPGYFTTIRITCLIAQTISFLLKKELLFIDSFSALKNVFNFVYKNFNGKPIPNEQIYLIKIASKRYRLKHNEIDLEITSLEEVTNLAKKENIKIIFNNLNQKEIEFFKKEKVDFVDLSNIYRAGTVYLSSKDDLKKSPDYNLKINY